MTEPKKAQIIAFVGLTGVGKSAAVDHMTEKGYPKVYVGGLIVEGVKEQGLEVNPENERTYRESMREQHGKEVFMKIAVEHIKKLIESGQHTVILDGLYTWTEYKLLKHEFPGEMTVIAIVAPKHLRHHRLTTRTVRPLTETEANERDWAEIENLEKGGPIAIADYFVHNDKTIEHLHAQIDDITHAIGL